MHLTLLLESPVPLSLPACNVDIVQKIPLQVLSRGGNALLRSLHLLYGYKNSFPGIVFECFDENLTSLLFSRIVFISFCISCFLPSTLIELVFFALVLPFPERSHLAFHG